MYNCDSCKYINLQLYSQSIFHLVIELLFPDFRVLRNLDILRVSLSATLL